MTTLETAIEKNRLEGWEKKAHKPEDLNDVFARLKESRRKLPSTIEGRFEVITNMADKWGNSNYAPRRRILPLLAQETPYTTQMIEFLTFSTFTQIADMNRLFEVNMKDMETCFGTFSPVPGIDGLLLRAHLDELSLLDKLKIWRQDYDIHSLLENAPEIVTSICAGNAPGLPVHQMNMALSIGSASLIKNPSEETLLGPAYLESLVLEGYDDVADSFAILNWSRHDEHITRHAIGNSDAVLLTGGARAVKAVEELIRSLHKDLMYDPHGHKAGISVVAREYLDDEETAEKVARCSAIDFTAWNQYACLSPREIRVELGGEVSPEEFSEMLADEMIYIGKKLGPDVLGHLHRQKLHRKYLGSEQVDLKSQSNYLDFGIVFYSENDIEFNPYSEVCMNRTVFVKPIDNIYDTIEILGRNRDVLQTIGVAIDKDRIMSYSEKLSEIGVSNIRSVGNTAFPRIGEPWDGRFVPFNLLNPLLNKIRWTSLSADIETDIKCALKRFEEFSPTKFDTYN